jgi:hypothetical protein
MARISTVTPVKLFIATLHAPDAPVDETASELKKNWGEFDYSSGDFPFEATGYYREEMGASLLRRFFSFSNLIGPGQIVEAKLFTNRLEDRFRRDGRRIINLDPGYLDFYKVVLASTKFGGQKVYMREGIYADMTLVHFKGKWESFAWGFPDFKSGAYDQVLFKIRDLYKAQLRQLRP